MNSCSNTTSTRSHAKASKDPLIGGHMKIILALLVLIIPLSTPAATIRGAGAGTCGEWIQDRKENYGAKLHWLQGYLSAYNYYVYAGKNKDGIFANTDNKAIGAWMDKYCQENPLNSPANGAIELIKELEQRADKE